MDYNEIINKNALKILEVIGRNKIYFNQIQELSKIKSKNNILKNLDNFVKLNILKKEKNKSNTFYSINYENNFSISMLNIINQIKFQRLDFEKRKAIEEYLILLKPGMAVLFGSTAKENYTKRSDIDILFVYNNLPKVTYDEVSEKYGVKINLIKLDFKELNKNNESINHMLMTGYPLTGSIYFYKYLSKIK